MKKMKTFKEFKKGLEEESLKLKNKNEEKIKKVVFLIGEIKENKNDNVFFLQKYALENTADIGILEESNFKTAEDVTNALNNMVKFLKRRIIFHKELFVKNNNNIKINKGGK